MPGWVSCDGREGYVWGFGERSSVEERLRVWEMPSWKDACMKDEIAC